MACNIERPTPQELFDRYRNLFQNTVLGGASVIPESNEWYAISVNYAMAEEFYAISEQAWKERDPRQACCDNLIAMGARDGVYPLPAQPAQGYIKLTGVANTILPTPLEFTVGDLQYVTALDETQPGSLDDNGSAVIRVRAVVPGEAGNITNETTGTLNTVVEGVDSEVEVCGGTFCNGSDSEECEIFRQRYLRRLQVQPRATNRWLQDKMLEWPCATRAITRGGNCLTCNCESPAPVTGSANGSCQDCGCVEGGGSMHFYLMFDNSFPNGIAPRSVLDEVEEWLFGSPQGFGLGQVEIGVCGRLYSVTGVPTNVRVDIGDCVSSVALSNARATVEEFFTTMVPSQPIEAAVLATSLQRVLGVSDVSVSLELVDPEDGYGQPDCPECDGNVFVSPCGIEPDCDYVLTLNDVIITSAVASQGGCP
jgi:uncharacterized phage protein gp47/JayE